MNFRKTVFLLAGFAFFLTVCWALPPSATSQTITLKYANFPPSTTFPCVQMERWKTEVEKKTAGKVAVQTFPGSTLLNPKNMFEGVVSGTADIGCPGHEHHAPEPLL